MIVSRRPGNRVGWLLLGLGVGIARRTSGGQAAAGGGPRRVGTDRVWVQAVVDRRFNRARYDATRVIDRFAGRLRAEVDLDGLVGDPHTAVAATMQPASVSVWLAGRGNP